MNKDTKAIKQTFIRENNVKLIVELLSNKPHSCLEISNEIKLSDVGVNKIIKQLLALNMIKKAICETEKKIGGQHIRYTINPNVGLYVCCDFTENVDSAYIYDFAGCLVDSVSFNISYRATKEEVLNAICLIRNTLEKYLNVYNNNLLGIGISVPGQININTNEFIETGKFVNLEKGELYNSFKSEFDTHVFLKHNVQLMAIGESYKGKLVNQSELATYVYAGVGLAACVLFDGKGVAGWNGYAGEIGGNKVYPASTLSRNCSLGRILEKLRETYPDIEYNSIFDLYKTDSNFHAQINESARIMAMFMNNVTNLLGCNLFMIAGDALKFGDEYLEVINTYLNKHAPIKVDVIKYSLDNAAIVGTLKLLNDYAIVDCYKKRLSNYNI